MIDYCMRDEDGSCAEDQGTASGRNKINGSIENYFRFLIKFLRYECSSRIDSVN